MRARKKNEKEKGRKKRSWREKKKERENIFYMKEEREI